MSRNVDSYQSSSSDRTSSGNKKFLRFWSDDRMLEMWFDLSKSLDNSQIKSQFCQLFGRDIDELEKVTDVSGKEVSDFSDLYRPSSLDTDSQFVLIFKAEKRTRSKRSHSSSLDSNYHYDNSSSDEEDSREVFKPKKALQCLRCGEQYSSTQTSNCSWHSGTFNATFVEKVFESPQNDVLLIDPDYDAELHSRSVENKEWSCCKSKLQNGSGCISGPHLSPQDGIELSTDQRLHKLFSNTADLEPPKQSEVSQQNQPQNEPIDLDDDDVEIIDRNRIFGVANFDAIVDLNRIIDEKMSFCLNEDDQHNLMSIIKFNNIGISYLQSDCDQELLITIGFTSQVKISMIKISALNLNNAPSSIKVYINKATLDFGNVEDMKIDQAWNLTFTDYNTENSTAILKVDPFKFKMVNTITLYISSNLGDEEKTIISRLNFLGAATKVR